MNKKIISVFGILLLFGMALSIHAETNKKIDPKAALEKIRQEKLKKKRASVSLLRLPILYDIKV